MDEVVEVLFGWVDCVLVVVGVGDWILGCGVGF